MVKLVIIMDEPKCRLCGVIFFCVFGGLTLSNAQGPLLVSGSGGEGSALLPSDPGRRVQALTVPPLNHVLGLSSVPPTSVSI